jgi:hypothetical protein
VKAIARILLAVAVFASIGCARVDRALPRCDHDERLALVAQSVPSAAYLPCVETLPPGWSTSEVEIRDGHSRISLRSDRAARPVEVDLAAVCDPTGASPLEPREAGVRTQQRLLSITPSYQGTIFDEFPGGCVTYRFDFERGPHLALMEELRQAVRLFPRRELRQALIERLGVDIDG